MATTKVEQRSGVVTVGCACTGGTSSLRCRWPWQQPFITAVMLACDVQRSTEPEDCQGGGHEQRSAEPDVPAGDTELFSLYEDELGGKRADRLYEVRPQERVQRRTVEQNVDNSLFLPTLDVPVPQMENQLVEVCRLFDVLIPEQAIAVPKITGAVCVLPSRRQNSWWKCRRSYPTHRYAELWSRTWIFQFLVVVVVSVSVYTQDRVQQRLVEQNFSAEQNFDIPVPRGSRDLPPASSSSGLLGTANQGVFRSFPRRKKVRRWVRTQGRNCSPSRAHPRRRLSWRVSSRMQLVCGCSSLVVGGNFWARIQKFGGLGDGWDGALVMRQPTDATESISSPSCSRCSHLESCALFPLSLLLAVIVLGVWVLLRSTRIGFFRR